MRMNPIQLEQYRLIQQALMQRNVNLALLILQLRTIILRRSR